MNDVAVIEKQLPQSVGGALTAGQIRDRVNLIQQVMQGVMKARTHYDTIPGTDKPSLLKAGAEVLCTTFRIAVDPEVQDLSVADEIRFRVRAVGRNQVTGETIGVGIGECSSYEEKYKWRRTVCDEEFDSFPEERKRIKFARGKNNTTYQNKQVRTEGADVANCVTPETLLLTHDLQWVPAGEIETGDHLIGVQEDLTSEYARHMAVGEATVHGRRMDEIYEVRLADGRVVRCNGEHQWLVKKVGLKGTEWVSTLDIYNEIIERNGRPRKWTIMSVGRPWVEEQSKEAGYLAGLFDADGSLGFTQVITVFAQQDNTVLALMERGLTALGFSWTKSNCKSQESMDRTESGKQVHQVRVRGGLYEQMRIIGMLRPPRILERWLSLVDLSKRRLEGKGSGAGRAVEVTSIEAVGEGEIVMLSTSCKTYIAEGLVCHNTILKMAKKRALVDFTLTALAASDIFAQDLEDMPEEIREATAERKQEVAEPKAGEKSAPVNVEGGVNETQVKILRKKMQDPKEEDALCKHFNVKTINEIPAAKINEALEFVEGKK